MKKIYANPEVNFVLLDDEDVIRTSDYEYNGGIVDSENQEDGEDF